MKDSYYIIILNILVLLLFLMLAFIGYQFTIITNRFDNILAFETNQHLSNVLYNETVINETKKRGVYSPTSDIYCAYTNHNTLKDKYNTDCHEYLHHLIAKDTCYNNKNPITCWQHFCGEEKICNCSVNNINTKEINN